MGGKGLHGLLNLLFNGDLNPNVSLVRPLVGKGPKPALARPSSWPLAKSSLQWRFKP